MSYFPMFVDLEGKRCLIAGGGPVALRKAQALLEFGARVTVAAPRVLDELKALEGVQIEERRVSLEELSQWDLVVAATDDREWNHRIGDRCRKERIPINAVDQQEDCSFIFPAYLKAGQVVAAFSSGGQSPALSQYLKQKTAPLMTEGLGKLAAFLGGLRPIIKERIEDCGARKEVYERLLTLGLEEGKVPSMEQVKEVIAGYRESQCSALEKEGLTDGSDEETQVK